MKHTAAALAIALTAFAAAAGPLDDLRARAEAGDAKALYDLARLYDTGYGQEIPVDTAMSTDLYTRAADLGYAPALNYLGFRFYRGEGVARDTARGLDLIARAAEAGDATAANNMGWLCAFGEESAPDYPAALRWFTKAADAGVPSAMAQLADLYRMGLGTAPDTLKATRLYDQALQHGLRDAEFKLRDMNRDRYAALSPVEATYLGRYFYTHGAPFLGTELLMQAASEGDAAEVADANALLGEAYALAKGVEYDHRKSLLHFYAGAAGGNPSAQFFLAELLEMMPDALDEFDIPVALAPNAQDMYEAAAEAGVTDAETAARLLLHPVNSDFWLGADISGTTADEARGRFTRNAAGEVTETTQLMHDLGLNAVRLRVWVDPKYGFSSPDDVLVMARRAKELGMPVMVDFHYSDWWADPGKQNIPHAWETMDYEQMKKALAEHTRSTLQLLRDAGIDVRWVQVGNETTNGFLWPMGRAQENMEQYAGLTQAGYEASKAVYPEAQVIVHLDNGFDPTIYDWIFDGLQAAGTRWDMIGMSLYPYWAMDAGKQPDAETTLRNAIENIKRLKRKYGTDVMIVEVGVESAKPEEGKRFIADVIEQSLNNTDGACKGVWYWAPEANDPKGGYGYALGAFSDDMPTAIMDAFTEAADRLAPMHP